MKSDLNEATLLPLRSTPGLHCPLISIFFTTCAVTRLSGIMIYGLRANWNES